MIHFSKSIVTDAIYYIIRSDIEINLFEAFKTIDNIPYLVYINKDNFIIFYDLNNNKKTFEIKNGHNDNISYIRYYLDQLNKRDLLLTISHLENNIKVWDINNLECILYIDSGNKDIFSANFLYSDNQINIISLYQENVLYSDEFNIYNLNGDKIDEIKYFHGRIFFIKTYYNKKEDKSYIITGHDKYIVSYDYTKGKQYRQYKDGGGPYFRHICAVINENDNEIKLIESCWDGKIRIWNFDSGKLLNKINLINKERRLNGICLWDNDYIFIGDEDGYIILIDIKNGNVIKKFKDKDKDNAPILSIEKISINIGECLITQEYNRNKINLWII